MLALAEQKLEMLKQDASKMRAKDLHELLRAWENQHRVLTAEAHLKHGGAGAYYVYLRRSR